MSNYKLSDICKIRYGKDHKSLDNGNIPVYGTGGIMRYVDSTLYEKESVLIPRKGTLSNLFYVDEPFWTIDTLFYTEIDKSKVLPKYLYFKLKTIDLAGMNVGTAVPSLTTALLNEIELNIPSLENQIKIVDILSSLENKIENNNAIIANLEKQAQTIFKSWFVDFEPFQDEEFVESEVGNIPKSFVVKKLEDISTIQNGYAFKSNDYIEKGIKVIRTLNIENNFLNESNYVYLPSEFHTDNSHLKHQLNLYDTLLVMVGSTIGKSGMILSNDLPSLQNQNMWRFRALDKKISPFYINYIVKKINEEVSGWTSGSAREFYRKDVFGKQKIAVPSLVVMERFNKLTQTLFAQIDILKQENNLLAKTRDTLLPKLMSGEIRVEEAIEVE